MSTTPTTPVPRSLGHRISSFFYRHPRLRLWLVLALPLAWFLVVYMGSLLALLVQSFYSLDSFTGTVDETLTLDTWRSMWNVVTRDIVARTVVMAALVTVGAALIAMPVGYFMARVASPRAKTVLFIAVLMPLWSSYIVTCCRGVEYLDSTDMVNMVRPIVSG